MPSRVSVKIQNLDGELTVNNLALTPLFDTLENYKYKQNYWRFGAESRPDSGIDFGSEKRAVFSL